MLWLRVGLSNFGVSAPRHGATQNGMLGVGAFFCRPARGGTETVGTLDLQTEA